MRTILGLMVLAMAVMVMGCSEPTSTTDANASDAAVTAGCDCCEECDSCEDGEKCECTSKDGSDCDCKCKDGSGAKGEAVTTEVTAEGAADAGSDNAGSDNAGSADAGSANK